MKEMMGETSPLALEFMNATETLTVFLRLFLQEEHILSIAIHSLGETG
jgi:hypothetical protein